MTDSPECQFIDTSLLVYVYNSLAGMKFIRMKQLIQRFCESKISYQMMWPEDLNPGHGYEDIELSHSLV